MRSVLFLCVCACYVVVGQDINSMQNMPKYDSRYDYLDVDTILDSKRLVRNYVECLINSQRCSPEGKALKRILPEALRSKCVRCTDRQKKTAVKVIKRLKYDYPEEWAKLSSKWDPTGDFTRYFEEVLAKNDFNTFYGNEISGSTLPPQPPTRPVIQTQPPTRPSIQTPYPPPIQPETSPSSLPPPAVSTSPRPIILNRFGDDGDLMMASPSSAGTTRLTPPPPPTPRPTTPPPIRTTYRPTPISWSAAASDAMPTRFPLRPLPPAYTTAITFIDQIGYKIMRTTELVTDILRNTVRAVVGG